MNKELVTLSAVLNDGDIATLLTLPSDIFNGYGDVHGFILDYFQKNRILPPKNIVEDKFYLKLPVDPGTTKHHAEELRASYLRKQIEQVIKDTAKQLQSGELLPAVEGLIANISAIKHATAHVRDMDATDIDSMVDHIRLVREMNANGGYGVRFDIPGIDDFLPSGVTPGMYGVVIGYPGRGKSWLVALMAARAWRKGKKVLYVSLEMSEAEVRNRFNTIVGDGTWSLQEMQRGNIDTEKFAAWADKAYDGKYPFVIVSTEDMGEFGPAHLRSKIEQYNPDVVIVDYLQLMSSGGNAMNPTHRIMALSMEMKRIARSTSTAIIAVGSATPDQSSDSSAIPEMEQVAWSKQISYDVDWMLSVGRDQRSPILGVAWRKNRNGPLYDFLFECDFDRGIFEYKENDFDI